MTISIAEFPRAAIEGHFESDQEFPNTPEIRKILKFYDLACGRSSFYSQHALSGKHDGDTKSQIKERKRLAIHWMTVKRSFESVLTLYGTDPDVKFEDFLSSL